MTLQLLARLEEEVLKEITALPLRFPSLKFSPSTIIYFPEKDKLEVPLRIVSPGLSVISTMGASRVPSALKEIVWFVQVPLFITIVSPAYQNGLLISVAEATVTFLAETEKLRANSSMNIPVNLIEVALKYTGKSNE